MKWRKKNKRIPYQIMLFLAAWLILFSSIVSDAQESKVIEEGKNGIVEIYVGLTGQGTGFSKIKSVSGCLVYNQSNGVYILTNHHNVHVTEEELKSFQEEQKLSEDEISRLTEAVRVVIKGDVLSEASIVADSEQQDFCILKTNDVMNEKSAFSLGNAADVQIGDTVYILGFSENASTDQGVQFDSSDVIIFKGQVEKLDGQTLYHTGMITEGNNGGALLDEDGYLIGLNNENNTDSEAAVYGALSVTELREVLDNFGIAYKSRERNEMFENLVQSCEEATELLESGKYQKKSLQALQSAVSSVQKLIEEDTVDEESIQSGIELLSQGKEALVEKVAVVFIVQIVLGVLCAVFFVWFLKLVIWFLGEGKNLR